jgi:hypothetical protein
MRPGQRRPFRQRCANANYNLNKDSISHGRPKAPALFAFGRSDSLFRLAMQRWKFSHAHRLGHWFSSSNAGFERSIALTDPVVLPPQLACAIPCHYRTRTEVDACPSQQAFPSYLARASSRHILSRQTTSEIKGCAWRSYAPKRLLDNVGGILTSSMRSNITMQFPQCTHKAHEDGATVDTRNGEPHLGLHLPSGCLELQSGWMDGGEEIDQLSN